jgi:hypothetical protein
MKCQRHVRRGQCMYSFERDIFWLNSKRKRISYSIGDDKVFPYSTTRFKREIKSILILILLKS